MVVTRETEDNWAAGWKKVEAGGLGQECLVLTSEAAGHCSSDKPTHQRFSASEMRSMDEIVQAFATYASNQSFAMSVGGGHTNW